ncbi:MAG: hypothetical protein IPO00_08915 [Betaproteobacteria bacterium]|nr:hypothetical protein [Betaproteobacteria bacterium]
MIGLTLLVVVGLYIAALVAVWRHVESVAARVAVMLVLLSPVIWKFVDMEIGHYRFTQACKVEAGVKIHDPNPAPVKRLRLEGSSFGASSAEGALQRYPSLLQVEAEDRKFSYFRPPAYGVYERLPDGKISSTLMDKVGKVNGRGESKVLESAPSHAEYVISETREHLPDRLYKGQHTLRHSDGRVVATVTSFGYTDTDPDHSLLRMPWGRADGCGPGRGELEILIDLIAPKK